MTTRFNTALLCASALASFGALYAAPAFAADAAADAATTDEAPSDIIVTARKRDESIVDVPLAISVVTSAKLEKLDIRSTSDLANYVPGLQFSDYTPGYARNDRGGTRPLIFRGINTGTGGSVSAAGGMFLDGAAVVGNEVPAGMDIGAVEILRGPQSVYFGRSTMTGAVSYRTKDIAEKFAVEGELTLAQRNRKDVEVSVSGSVIPGLLKARITGLWEDTDGYMTNTYNNGNSKLGDRSRKSISLTTVITPASTVNIKTYVNYFRDEDGPSATVFLPAYLDNCTLPGATQKTFCGKLPSRSNSINYFNTDVPASAANYIFASPLLKGAGFKKQMGLQREVLNSHVVANWDVSDYLTVQSITGYHINTTLQAADGKAAPQNVQGVVDDNKLYFYQITNKSRDFSQELRLTSDPKRSFSWTVGANYVNAYDKTNPMLYFLKTSNAKGGVIGENFSPQALGTQLAKTYGIFAGAYLKLFDDRLTLSAEGRYQTDKRGLYNTTIATAAPNSVYLATPIKGVTLRKDFSSFNPRGSVDFDLGGGRKIYASYASGTRPGGFNGSLQAAIDRRGVAAVQAAFGLTSPAYDEEKLKIGELGIKGAFDGGKGYFDLNGYYGKLTNQQISTSAILPGDGFSTTATANIGETEFYGVEAQGNYTLMRGLSVSGTFAWNHAVRTKFDSFSSIAQFGTRNLSGKKTANAPEFSGSGILSYEVPISDTWNAFYNGSLIYRGKQYVDVFNAAYIKGRWQGDVRLGVSNDTYTIEGFVTNVFNDRSYTGGSVAPQYDNLTFNAFFGAVAEPRTFGGRLRIKI